MDKREYLLLRYLALTTRIGDTSPFAPGFNFDVELEARVKRREAERKPVNDVDAADALSALQELAGTKNNPDSGSPVTISFDEGGTNNYDVSCGKKRWYGATILDAMILRAEQARHEAELEKLNARSVAAH